MKTCLHTACLHGVIFAMTLFAAGCTSFRSTHFYADGSTGQIKKEHVDGIPTTIKVPTGIRLEVVDVFYLVTPSGATNKSLLTKDNKDPNSSVRRSRQLRYEIVNTDKLIMVDFKRPAAGTLKTKLTLDADENYITGIDNEIVDQTLVTTAAAIQKVLAEIPKLATLAAEDQPDSKELPRIESVVASRLFNINDPALEQSILAFLGRYINDCTPTCGADSPELTVSESKSDESPQ